jgi:hypothetical protein
MDSETRKIMNDPAMYANCAKDTKVDYSKLKPGKIVFRKDDPWAYRSEKMRCATCMWFVEKGAIGRCRRHAPTMNGYPMVFKTDWCGDHKLDEEKV